MDGSFNADNDWQCFTVVLTGWSDGCYLACESTSEGERLSQCLDYSLEKQMHWQEFEKFVCRPSKSKSSQQVGWSSIEWSYHGRVLEGKSSQQVGWS